MFKSLKDLSKNIKKNILDMSLTAGINSAHFGGALSSVEILTTLYGNIMKIKKNEPTNEENDRFILSKGHGCLSYYSVLMEMGFINKDEISTFEKNSSDLLGHPVINKKKGINFSTGSLGMGLSLGIGVAIAFKKKKLENKVFVLLGDGECNEGSIWESAMAATHFKLNNITAIIDKNNFQQTGSTKEIMSNDNIDKKWSSFGWDVKNVDGHSIKELNEAFLSLKDRPLLIVANTVKGKGFSFSEANNYWHHAILTKDQYDKALKELNDE